MLDPRVAQLQALLPKAMLPDWVRLGSRLVRLLRDRHHAGFHGAVLDRLLSSAQASVALRERRQRELPSISYPLELPITSRRDEIIEAIRRHQAIIIAGETGSGKTTQIPKMCLEAGLGIEAKIGCTQPRRVAALSISRRLAEELNVEWGREVGCKIRFSDRSSPETYIKLMTDGILLAETQGDPLLSEYNAIIIDEAHERSLNIDFLLGYLKNLLLKRSGLKLIITSATIETEAFSRAFNDAPVIEVSGRVYPVEVRYAPIEPDSEESGELTYVDAAVRATTQVVNESQEGDILVFMPSERDIRETRGQLVERHGDHAEIIPLFGRLGAGDQERVFAPATMRKIVVATNIAETSLTIPGIRYVIDTGLARISRYNPRTRTKRLPIEEVAQSSANQRKGRSGRVQSGICIRLYSEADFVARPRYTQPEIQRANLAEVILRMKAFRLGEIETFPFINPPSPGAIQAGYALLQELGALNETRELTPLGRDLARLPIDPTLGRMLLHSQQEHATRELLIIASGLSIQDPREMPQDARDLAVAAHKRFADPRSDFLTLLNIWNAAHDDWESLPSQSQRRKFCKTHFLSYNRMREWQDLHAQLHEALDGLGTLRLNESNAAYETIHRSILTGLLGHVAARTERNQYKGVGNRLWKVFPGSALFERAAPAPKPKKGLPPQKPRSTSQPEWIVCGEIVETSQVFARTVAGIDPLWITQLAPHLCHTAHSNPHWSVDSGRVLADETTTLYGLEVRRRKVAYGNINPEEATRIFIRCALVEEDLVAEPQGGRRDHSEKAQSPSQLLAYAAASREQIAPRYEFLEHNRQVRHKIETWQTRARRHDLPDLDDALVEFYSRRLVNVSSLHELNRFLREPGNAASLRANESDLVAGHKLEFDAAAFPDEVQVGGQKLTLTYAYSPGEEQDGVTVKLNPVLAQHLPAAALEWAVPGLREPQIAELLRALPKAIRRQLMPLAPKVSEIARELRPAGDKLTHSLAAFIRERYQVDVPASAWPANALPGHLQPRIEIVGHDKKPLRSGRNLRKLREELLTANPPKAAGNPPQWEAAAGQWERFGISTWNFADVPERITVNDKPPLYAWPGLELESGVLNIRLFATTDAARDASRRGFPRLLELGLQKDLAWLQNDLRMLSRLAPLLANFCTVEELQETAGENLRNHILPTEPPALLTRAAFDSALDLARQRLPGLAYQLFDRLQPILELRHKIAQKYAPKTPLVKGGGLSSLSQLGTQPANSASLGFLSDELNVLVPRTFLRTVPFERLLQLPRYLKALLTRVERALLNPLKDQERARQLAPYVAALRKLQAGKTHSETARRLIDEFRWSLEEFKVSLFAQELGTAFPVSAPRLDAQLEAIRRLLL
jgi:ATP-dependent helicase HrpA